jgi:hypothetical protein
MAYNAPTSATGYSPQEVVIVLPSSVRCRYKNRFCNNHRATKDNGELHSLCDEHRTKANENQKRLRDNQRRRLAQLLQQAQAGGPSADTKGDSESTEVEMEIEPLAPHADGSLSPSDWQELAELWTDEDADSTEEEQKRSG